MTIKSKQGKATETAQSSPLFAGQWYKDDSGLHGVFADEAKAGAAMQTLREHDVDSSLKQKHLGLLPYFQVTPNDLAKTQQVLHDAEIPTHTGKNAALRIHQTLNNTGAAIGR